jgi:stalled ribosome alternative rescue factor ArfA
VTELDMPNSQENKGKGSYARQSSGERKEEKGSFTGRVLQRGVKERLS